MKNILSSTQSRPEVEFFTDKDRFLLIRLLQTARDQGRTFLDKANRKCTLENRNWAFLLKKAEIYKKDKRIIDIFIKIYSLLRFWTPKTVSVSLTNSKSKKIKNEEFPKLG